MLELARKTGSHHCLRRQQGEDGEENDATPSEEAQRCCDKAGSDHHTVIDPLGRYLVAACAPCRFQPAGRAIRRAKTAHAA